LVALDRFPHKKFPAVEVMFGPSDDSAWSAPFSASESGFAFDAGLSPIEFSYGSPFFPDAPFDPLDISAFESDPRPPREVKQLFEVPVPQQPLSGGESRLSSVYRPFASFEATETTVLRLKHLQ
jgi:hypothetical protein